MNLPPTDFVEQNQASASVTWRRRQTASKHFLGVLTDGRRYSRSPTLMHNEGGLLPKGVQVAAQSSLVWFQHSGQNRKGLGKESGAVSGPGTASKS